MSSIVIKMYRLLKIQKIYLQNSHNNYQQIYNQSTMKLCSFCRVYHIVTPKITDTMQWRYQSTISTALLPIIKKIKRKPKKYAELLEVTDNSTNNRKAAIRKLNASHLSLLVQHQGITLDKLHKMDTSMMESCDMDKTQHDDKHHVSVVEDMQTSGISDPACIIKSTSLLKSMAIDHSTQECDEEPVEVEDSVVNIAKKNKEKSKQKEDRENTELVRLKNLQEQVRRESLVRTLNAYLRVCVSCGMIGRAFHTIMHYRKHGNNPRVKSIIIRDISLYNIMLQAYAIRGNVTKLQEFMQIIKADGVIPVAKTYAAVFECYGNINITKSDLEYLQSVQNNMIQQAITYDDILNESKTKLKQFNTVLHSIRKLDPSFEPKKVTSDNSYDCHLLNKITPDTEICASPAENLISLCELDIKFKNQVKHEMEGHVEIKSIEKFDTAKPIVSYYRDEIKNLEKYWKVTVSEAFDRDLKALKNREHKPIPNAMVLYPCLCVLSKEEYVNAIMGEIRKLADGSETFSPSFASLCRRLGKYINGKYEMLENKNSGYVSMTEKVYNEYSNWYINRNENMNSRIAWQRITERTSKNFTLELEPIQWPVNLQFSVGKFLYGIILKDVKLNVNCIKPGNKTEKLLPAFYTLFRSTSAKHLVEEIKPHPILSKIYRESQPETLNFDTCLVPSECPPRPWTTMHTGGYLLLKTDVVRVPVYAMEQWKRLESVKPKQLWPSLDCLNQLGSIPWAVNTPILDLAVEIFRNGGSAKLNVPQPPSVLAPVPLLQENSTEDIRKSIGRARMELKRKKSEMYSLWCDALYRLSLANHFRDKIFWLPHNMDFRGRVYPVPPHLNHLGSDLARSMLIFALGKPLGPNGLDWLKIHTINLTGFKKRDPISERLKYANEIIDKILDSADNPLTGEMWWTTSDEPWQTLAACKEISAALKSSNHQQYICRFPIHQDGSCNGLQHYAALGRDQIGAENVNLHPSHVPQDVYSSVAAMVDSTRRKDAADGNEVAQALEGFIKRKVIKQTVMTTVYGVTKFGARLQIARQLKDIDDFPQEHVWAASMYLAQKTFDSLRTMFESARKIQDWFTDCARIISTMKGCNMEWVTPLGLPVIQPYSKIVPSKFGLKEITVDSCEKPNTTKQKNAFAPNFIHSLDSCHMMLTSLHCEHNGITFVSVHDCYWTHPCTVEIMNKICRQQFVALHSQPILEDLSRFFIDKYIDNKRAGSNDDLEAGLSERKLIHTLSSVPKKGDFKLEGVLNSQYFFS